MSRLVTKNKVLPMAYYDLHHLKMRIRSNTVNYYDYLSSQDIAELKRYHKKAGFVQFHSMQFYIPCDTTSPSSYAVYSYYTCVGYVDNDNKTILLDKNAYNYSRTTTRQIRRFIKEFKLKEIKQ